MRWTVITNCDSFFITKFDTVYYKLQQVLRSAIDLLQIVTGISKCDDYYKLRQYKESNSSFKLKWLETGQQTVLEVLICSLNLSYNVNAMAYSTGVINFGVNINYYLPILTKFQQQYHYPTKSNFRPRPQSLSRYIKPSRKRKVKILDLEITNYQ